MFNICNKKLSIEAKQDICRNQQSNSRLYDIVYREQLEAELPHLKEVLIVKLRCSIESPNSGTSDLKLLYLLSSSLPFVFEFDSGYLKKNFGRKKLDASFESLCRLRQVQLVESIMSKSFDK